MGVTFFFEWEVKLMIWLQSVLGEGFSSIGSFITLFGEQFMLVAIMGFLYWSYDKELGKFVGLNTVLTNVWNPFVKNIFLRRRPYFDNPGIKCLKPVEADADLYDIAAQGYSFPSGHSMNASTVYGSLAYKIKKRWAWSLAVVLILLVGFSRVYLGCHYPTDVLVGWTFGVVIVVVSTLLQKKIKNKKVLYSILFITAVPGFFFCTSDDYFTGMGLLIGTMAGFLFEERFVKFENTRVPVRMILRVVGGGIIYFALNTILKMPFSKEFLKSATIGAYLVRTMRYAVILFVVTAVYPMVFKVTDRFFSKKAV